MLAALATGRSRLIRPLRARDTALMASGLGVLGTGVQFDGDDLVVIPGTLGGPADIDCGLAGTVMRFLPPVAALATGRIGFDGDPRARERPLKPLLDALRTIGVAVRADADSLPFELEARGGVRGGAVTIDASGSSQFVSGLLLAASAYDDGLDLRHDGKPLPSTPHVDMTVEMLRRRGVDVDTAEPNRWVVRPIPIAPVDAEIEPDLSNAAPFLAAGLVTGGCVRVRRWPTSTRQAGDRIRDILAAFGAEVRLDDEGLTVSGNGQVSGIDYDLHEVGELTPVVAAVAALADSPSQLRGIAHLRGHETDRLAALAGELSGLGADARETADGLQIRPRDMTGGLFHAHQDHRMAHAAAVIGLAVPGVLVDDIATTGKAYPGFADAWQAMLG